MKITPPPPTRKKNKCLKRVRYCSSLGRSMVEMIAVLAIIGVLSIAAVAGIRFAMEKHTANQISKEAFAQGTYLATKILPPGEVFKNYESSLINETHRYCANNYVEVHVADVSESVCEKILKSLENPAKILKSVTVGDDGATSCAVGANKMVFTFYGNPCTGTGEPTIPDPDNPDPNNPPIAPNCTNCAGICCQNQCYSFCTGNGMTGFRDDNSCLCLCDTASHFRQSNGQCVCATGYTLVDEECVPSNCVGLTGLELTCCLDPGASGCSCSPACGTCQKCVAGACIADPACVCNPVCDTCQICRNNTCITDPACVCTPACGTCQKCENNACVADTSDPACVCTPACGTCQKCENNACVADTSDPACVCTPACGTCQKCENNACVADTSDPACVCTPACGTCQKCENNACVADTSDPACVCTPACTDCTTCQNGACVADDECCSAVGGTIVISEDGGVQCCSAPAFPSCNGCSPHSSSRPFPESEIPVVSNTSVTGKPLTSLCCRACFGFACPVDSSLPKAIWSGSSARCCYGDTYVVAGPPLGEYTAGCCEKPKRVKEVSGAPTGEQACCDVDKAAYWHTFNTSNPYPRCCTTGGIYTYIYNSATYYDCCDLTSNTLLQREQIYGAPFDESEVKVSVACCPTGQTAYWSNNSPTCCNGTTYRRTYKEDFIYKYGCCQVNETIKVLPVTAGASSTVSGGYACCGLTQSGAPSWVGWDYVVAYNPTATSPEAACCDGEWDTVNGETVYQHYSVVKATNAEIYCCCADGDTARIFWTSGYNCICSSDEGSII